MKRLNLLFYVSIILVLLSSCKKNEDSVTPIPSDILLGDTNFELFDNTFILNGRELAKGLEGSWSVLESTDSYLITDSSDPKSEFKGSLLGQYKLRWTVSNGVEVKSADISIKIVGFTDSRDGIKYKVVRVGNQFWMAENLKTQKYQNGDLINNGSTVGDYSTETEPKYWFAYNDDLNNINDYGRLYTWYVVNDSRKICPVGWHIPSDSEWNLLGENLGMTPVQIQQIDDISNIVGGRSKEAGLSHWLSPNSGATDGIGFKALPAGYRRRLNKEFAYKGEYACFWSSSVYDNSNAYYRHLYYNKASICRTYNLKNYGFSVRCVKDN